MYKTGAAVFVQQQPPYAPYGPPSGNMFQPSYPPQQHMVGGSSHQGQQQQQYNATAPPPQAYHPQPERDYNDIHKEPRSMYPRPDYEWHWVTIYCMKRITMKITAWFDHHPVINVVPHHRSLQLWVYSLIILFMKCWKLWGGSNMSLRCSWVFFLCAGIRMGTWILYNIHNHEAATNFAKNGVLLVPVRFGGNICGKWKVPKKWL